MRNAPSYGAYMQASPTMTLDPCDARTVDAVEDQQRITSWPYYSTVKFTATRAEDAPGGPYTYTLARGTEVRAFGYGLREDKSAGGYQAPALDGLATRADTNIVTKNQTISGQFVHILGLALQWHPSAVHGDNSSGSRVPEQWFASAEYLAALDRLISVRFSVNGDDNTYKMGTIGMSPGAGGLFGGAPRSTALPFLDGGQNAQFPNNGYPTRQNFFPIPEGIWWNTSDKPDGNMNVIFSAEEDVVVYSGGSPSNRPLGTDQAAIADISAGYNYPSVLVAELKVFVIGQVYGGRTRTA